MSQESRKQLVSKGRYARLVTRRAALLSVSTLLSTVGAVVLCSVVWAINDALRSSHPGRSWLTIGLGSAGSAFFAAYSFFVASLAYKEERKVERVAPLTKRAADRLPPEESLVRASDISASGQQAELLRMAAQGPETPAEQLLRATEAEG